MKVYLHCYIYALTAWILLWLTGPFHLPLHFPVTPQREVVNLTNRSTRDASGAENAHPTKPLRKHKCFRVDDAPNNRSPSVSDVSPEAWSKIVGPGSIQTSKQTYTVHTITGGGARLSFRPAHRSSQDLRGPRNEALGTLPGVQCLIALRGILTGRGARERMPHRKSRAVPRIRSRQCCCCRRNASHMQDACAFFSFQPLTFILIPRSLAAALRSILL